MAVLGSVRTGTSGFSYKEWKGPFYPEKLKNADMLSYYAGRLAAVEINNTFYRMPKKEVLEKWRLSVPADFRFVLKASRRITHFGRLKEGSRDSVEYLLSQAEGLGDSLGPILLQLPPNFPCNLERLATFLGYLPKGRAFAFEFRHASWHEQEVFDLLREHEIGLCVADSGGEGDAPVVATADWGYFRLRRPDYDEADLRSWAERIRELGLSEAYVFFKHEDAGAGPRMAEHFRSLLESDGSSE